MSSNQNSAFKSNQQTHLQCTSEDAVPRSKEGGVNKM